MESTHPSPVSTVEQPRNLGAGAAANGVEQALVASPQEHERSEPPALSRQVARLPVELDVAIPVREFRVRNLLALEPGQVIETGWALGADMPLASGQAQLAWSEFEVIESQLAVRVTRLL
jgi:flagellar motor switch protein FliN/FliY